MFITLADMNYYSWMHHVHEYKDGLKLDINNSSIEEIKTGKPTVIFIPAARYARRDLLDDLRRQFPKARLIGHHNVDIYENDVEVLKKFDFIYTGLWKFKNELKELGMESEVIPNAFYTPYFDRIKAGPLQKDILFCGSVLLKHNFHGTRLKDLMTIIERDLPHLFRIRLEDTSLMKHLVKLAAYYPFRYLKDRNAKVAQVLAEGRPVRRKYPAALLDSANEPVFGEAMLKELKSHLITLNPLSDIGGREGNNMRMMEVTGMGSMLMQTHTDNVEDFFTPGEEIILYSDQDELYDKASWHISNDSAAAKIARRGMEKTRKHFSVEKVSQLIK